MRFDPTRAHSVVYGVPGVAYQQNGRYFQRNGTPVDGDPDRDREIAEIREKLVDADTAPEVRDALRAKLAKLTTSVPVVPPVMRQAPSDDMRLSENKRLKAMVEQYGEEWQGAAHAREFLGEKAA